MILFHAGGRQDIFTFPISATTRVATIRQECDEHRLARRDILDDGQHADLVVLMC
jgi:hypothetical protein